MPFNPPNRQSSIKRFWKPGAGAKFPWSSWTHQCHSKVAEISAERGRVWVKYMDNLWIIYGFRYKLSGRYSSYGISIMLCIDSDNQISIPLWWSFIVDIWYPLVNVYITMEHHHVEWEKSLFQLGHGFNSYVYVTNYWRVITSSFYRSLQILSINCKKWILYNIVTLCLHFLQATILREHKAKLNIFRDNVSHNLLTCGPDQCGDVPQNGHKNDEMTCKHDRHIIKHQNSLDFQV